MLWWLSVSTSGFWSKVFLPCSRLKSCKFSSSHIKVCKLKIPCAVPLSGLALSTFQLFSLLTSWKAQNVKKKTLRLLMHCDTTFWPDSHNWAHLQIFTGYIRNQHSTYKLKSMWYCLNLRFSLNRCVSSPGYMKISPIRISFQSTIWNTFSLHMIPGGKGIASPSVAISPIA